MVIALSVLGVALLFGLWLISFYNRLVAGRNLVEEAWSGIKVQLKRRHDLIPSLVNTVKGYAAHEQQTLEKVILARTAAVSAQKEDVQSVMQAENGLSAALRKLFALSESYPELKANENFLHLQKQLASLEDEIQMARRYYNGTARDQNNRVQQFPGNLVASRFGFEKTDYFDLENEEEAAVPQVQF